ncbi:MAG: FkbM family methyltransferase [Myxococcales bacterium]|nr:FkbM family methyltransferase [Myxococcales bacterium]
MWSREAAVNDLRDLLERHPRLRRAATPLLEVRRRLLMGERVNQERNLSALFRNVVSGALVVRIDNISGEFELDARSDLLRRVLVTGAYEPAITHLLERHVDPGRDVIDVGANVGLLTVCAARRIGRGRRVLALEPSPSARSRLEANLKRNGVADRTIVFAGCAAERSGDVVLKTIDGREEYSSLRAITHPSTRNDVTTDITVDSVPLDTLIDRHGLQPGFIKIDVEGAEFTVLRGAIHTLLRHRPVLVVEIADRLLRNFETTSADVFSFLRGLRYELRDAESENKLRSPFNGNILCLPLES